MRRGVHHLSSVCGSGCLRPGMTVFTPYNASDSQPILGSQHSVCSRLPHRQSCLTATQPVSAIGGQYMQPHTTQKAYRTYKLSGAWALAHRGLLPRPLPSPPSVPIPARPHRLPQKDASPPPSPPPLLAIFARPLWGIHSTRSAERRHGWRQGQHVSETERTDHTEAASREQPDETKRCHQCAIVK